jgi:3-oxoacyl-(acyl-carrier-protein) synthase
MAEHFGCFTDYTTISTACSSAANALILGANMLKAGEADIVVAGGTEALSLFHLNGFNSLMILDKERCRPFDDTRAGLNLGEGAAFVVMETEEHARHRQAPIHAYLSGYGNACDAFHQTASSDNGEGAFLAMREALGMAGLQPADIDYVNAHGTGTPNNDQSESVALQRVFGSDLPPVSSTKGFTGHTTSASGSIEAVICLLAMHHGFIPANLGFAHPMTSGIVPSIGADGCQLRHVLCNSFGFGGNDSSLVFSASDNSRASLHTPHSSIKELSRVEITSIDQLSEIRDYVKPLEARRMGKLMKASLLSSLKALKLAGVECPDAIITGTALGCWENSEALLMQMLEEGEVMLSPTNFMQSTHNTISSNIAIRLGCHGYNVTYTQSDDSLEWALRDARLLLQSGRYKTVLVGCHDETTPLYRSLMERLGIHDLPDIHSIAIVLSNS